jgi:WD40 repeat protein
MMMENPLGMPTGNKPNLDPTAPIIATGSSDETVKLWRLTPDNSAASCVATLGDHSDPVWSVAFHPTANILATGSSDDSAKLWRLTPDNSAASCFSTLAGDSWVFVVAFHPTAPILAIGGEDNVVKLWR